MSRNRFPVLIALGLCGAICVPLLAQNSLLPKIEKAPNKATLDKPIKDFKLKDVMHDLKPNEKEEAAQVALSQFKDKKATLLFFMSEKCSVTWRYEKRMGQLMQAYGKKGIAFVGVRCSANDTPEGLRKFAESKNFEMPVLNDAKGALTSYFRVTNTPTFAVLDKKGVLRYRGSFDDSAEEEGVKATYVKDALNAVLENKQVAMKSTAPFG